MVSAFQDIAGIGGGILLNIVKVLAVAIFSVVLYFVTRWIQKGTKKQKAFTINVEIVDMNGVVEFDKLGFMKSDKTGLLEMQFQKRKSDSIPPIPKHLIKNNHVMLLNYAPAHYAVIDTYQTMQNIQSGKGGMELVNLGMKKYLMSKQREIMNKAEEKKRKFELYAPWFTLGIAVLAVVLFASFLLYMGVKLDSANIAARVLECQAGGWK
jgi:hypothetical protein